MADAGSSLYNRHRRSTPVTLVPGTRLGAYEILSAIGAGGMGEVYQARDTRLDRIVAIKVLAANLGIAPEACDRFRREARSIAALNHSHICTLYDVGQQQGVDYLVMEYLEGETMASRLAKGPLPIDQAIKYGVQIAEALDKAHRQGIVHRDLKPQNVMLTKAGAKLLDFGLAKMTAPGITLHGMPDAQTAGPTRQATLTAQGTILGTFQYMAPEQLEGKEADTRTDIFAVGALLFEMATARPAFEGKSHAGLIAAILDAESPAISSIQPLTPPALDHVVRKCLRKDPDDRWQSAHDLASELRWIAEAGSQAGVAAPIALRRRSRERVAWIAAGMLALVAATLAVAGHTIGQPVAGTLSSLPCAKNAIHFASLGLRRKEDSAVGIPCPASTRRRIADDLHRSVFPIFSPTAATSPT